jgi:ribosome maturation factor RimP
MHGNSRLGGTREAAADAGRVASVLAPVVSAMGMDLEGVTITPAGRRRLLRVVVDADGGVTLDDIALASREVSRVLDRSAVMGEAAYTLEVSSPGVDRPLTQPRHWQRAVGRLVTVPVGAPPAGSPAQSAPHATVSGRVTSADDRGVTLEVDGESIRVAYAELGRGRVRVEFAPPGCRADEEDSDGH